MGAQANDPAFQAGMVIGIIIAVLVSGSIPIAVGISKKQPVIGAIGGVCAGGTAVLFGCLGGLPVALAFVVAIVLVAGGQKPPRRSYDDDDDFDPPYDDDRPGR